MNATITPEQRKKISQGAALLGRLGGASKSEALQKARRKSIAIARKFRHPQTAKTA